MDCLTAEDRLAITLYSIQVTHADLSQKDRVAITPVNQSFSTVFTTDRLSISDIVNADMQADTIH